MTFSIEGVVAPVFTPFNESGSLNTSNIPSYMEYLNKHHVNGVLVGGTTGEAMSLSVQERKLVLEAWMLAAKPFGAKVIAQVGGAPLPDVLELAKHAEKMKVDAIMTLPELYYKPKNVEQLVSYLDWVSKAAPTLPLIYYHFPMMTAVNVNMKELFLDASSKITNFKGAKADLAIADQVAEIMTKDQRIFIANHQIAPSVLMGHESSIATVSNIFPDLVHNIVAATKNGHVSKVKVLQRRLNLLVDIISSHGDFVPAMKYAMEVMTNLNMGPVRQPLNSLNAEQKIKLKESLQKLDFSEEITV